MERSLGKKLPLISIILPVYNGETYITDCIESIKKQTYQNFEVLVINDGGTQDAIEISKKIVDGDDRFLFFEKKNGGISDTRNFGLYYAKGDYITFIDQDDFFDEAALEVLYYAQFLTGSEISIGNYGRLLGDVYQFVLESDLSLKVLNLQEVLDNLDDKSLFIRSNFTTVWGSLFKRELFKNIYFPENQLDEDGAIIWKLYSRAKKIIYLSRIVYTWRYVNDSVSNNFDVKQLASIDHREERMKFMDINSMDLSKIKWAYTDNVGYYALKTRKLNLPQQNLLQEKWELAQKNIFPFLLEKEE